MKETETTEKGLLSGKMNRRELFSKTAKVAIPTLGIIGLTLAGLSGKAEAGGIWLCSGCGDSCSSSCESGCQGCKGSCGNMCAKNSGP